MAENDTCVPISGLDNEAMTLNDNDLMIVDKELGSSEYETQSVRVSTLKNEIGKSLTITNSDPRGTVISTIKLGNTTKDITIPSDIGGGKCDCDFATIYRYQSNANANGEYSWFEIWPDGWCRQGGSLIHKEVGTTAAYHWRIDFDVSFENTSYTIQSIRKSLPNAELTTKDSIDNLKTNLLRLGIVTYIGKDKEYCIIDDGIDTNSGVDLHGNIPLIDWTAEGYKSSEETIESLKERFTEANGHWSSSTIGLNGTIGGNYGAGGVVDGTILRRVEFSAEDIKNWTHTEKTGEVSYTYITQNDCLLNIYMYPTFNSSISDYCDIYIGGERIHHQGEEPGSINIPIKSGTEIIIKLYYATGIVDQTPTLKFTEFKLQSLAPQIAIPDWDRVQEVTLDQNLSYTCKSSGYVKCAMNTNNTGSKVTVNGNYISDVMIDSIGHYYFPVIPVSEGDVVKFDNNNAYRYELLYFIPCKSVPQPDCASYVIESWHDDNGNWYRIYSDGWCEQGGTQNGSNTIISVRLHKQYKDTSYKVQATSVDTHVSAVYGLITITGKTTTSFTITGAQNQPTSDVDIVDWEAKGYIR